MEHYNFLINEKKWQDYWEKNKSFKTQPLENNQKKFYILEMFPYPSGKIHMGHVRNYVLGDVVARFKRLQGYNVLHPMGWDAFGLPAENAARAQNIDPQIWTEENIKAMRTQLKRLGLSFDWDREISTCSDVYCKNEQELFILLFKKGLIYRKEAPVYWDPVEETVLANEQVIDGRGWRSGAEVVIKNLTQWFVNITKYARELQEDLEKLTDWPQSVRTIQKQWIRSSEGLVVRFQLKEKNQILEVFSTRPETLYGTTFCAIAPQHPLVKDLSPSEDLKQFLAECEKIGLRKEAQEKAEKIFFFTNLHAIHPIDGRILPIYIANFVSTDYAKGAIFGVPAHDSRDHEMAMRYHIPSIEVLEESLDGLTEPTLINSSFFSGLTLQEGRRRIIEYGIEKGWAEKAEYHQLRDWSISRQRYWGTPIPIIHCPSCGIVPETQLPVLISDKDKPVRCPSCQSPAHREQDTLDTFFESSWYFLRFCSPHADVPFTSKDVCQWMPVDLYIGGIEHAVMHLLYARFFTKALRDCDLLPFDEPFSRLFHQGMISHLIYRSETGEYLEPSMVFKTEEGDYQTLTNPPTKVIVSDKPEKMSKSKKNIIDPEKICDTYGADTLRLFILSDAPPERSLEWKDDGIEGYWRYVRKLWLFFHKKASTILITPLDTMVHFSAVSQANLQATHKTLKEIESDYDQLRINGAIAKIRSLSNLFENWEDSTESGRVAQGHCFKIFLFMLFPLAPHLAEELWSALGYPSNLTASDYHPQPNPLFLEETQMTLPIQISGKLRANITVPINTSEEDLKKMVLELPQIANHLKNQPIKKWLIIPSKIINIVV